MLHFFKNIKQNYFQYKESRTTLMEVISVKLTETVIFYNL